MEQARLDDVHYFNLDTLPTEAVRALVTKREAELRVITTRKKRSLSPVVTNKQSSLLAYGVGAPGSGQKNLSPTLRNLKDTKNALQEKARYVE